jgi:hypothetical protein
MAEIGGLKIAIGASVDDFMSGLAGVKNSLGGLGTFASSALGLLANPIALATTAIIGIGAAAFSVGKDFEAAMGTIRAGTGATGEDLEALGASAKNVFVGVPEDIGKVSSTLADLNTNLGLTGQPLEQMTKQFLDLERLPLGFSGNVQTLTRVFGDWSVATGDQSGAMDFLAKTAQSTGVGVDNLATKVVQFGAPMREMGFNFEQSVALFGKWQKEGVNTEAIMSGLRTGFQKFSEQGKSSTEGLQDTINAIKNAGSAAEANKISFETFGSRAGVDLARAVSEGRFEIDALVASIDASPDSISKMAEDTLTLGDRFSLLTNNLTVLLEPLGTLLVGALNAIVMLLVDNVNPAVEFMGELWGGLLGFMQPLTDFIGQTVIPSLKTLFETWLGIQLLISDAVVPVLQFLWNNVLAPLGNFVKDALVAQFNVFVTTIETLLGWLGKIPGVSALVEAAQGRVKQAFADTGTESGTTKDKLDDLTTATGKTGDAQDKVSAPTGSAPKMTAALKKQGEEAEKTAEKLDLKLQAAIIALAIEEGIADQKTAALTGKVAALQSAFDDVEQPVIDMEAATRGMQTAASDLGGVLDIVSPKLPEVGAGADTAWGAFDQLGIKSKQLKEQELAQLGTALGTLKQAYEDGKIPVEDLQSAQEAYAEALKEQGGPTHETGVFAGVLGDVRTGLYDLANDLLTFNFGNMGETLKGLGIQLLDTFTANIFTGPDGFITKGINVVMGALDGLINKITGGVGGALTNVFGGGLPGVGGGGPSVPGVPTGGGGGGGGAAGSAGGLMGTLGAIGSIGSMVSGIIGNFQNARQETTLNAIEENTRFAMIILGGAGQDSGISKKLSDIQEGVWFGPGVKAVEDFRNKWFDLGLPVFRALETQGAFVQPTLNDISQHGVWQIERLDRIVRNTERTAFAVEQMRGAGWGDGSSFSVEQFQTAIERNEGGITTTLNRFVRGR